mmetsp:Transcript_12241/g.18537  ORF Transcript_12241/g.18537 Transcript_12241/m.18537 type:complete len:279 (-) Transcript_12241:180-1016(-)
MIKRILVTGANKGIGKALCTKILSEYPDTYVLLGSRDRQRGEEAVESIIQDTHLDYRPRIDVLVVDVSCDSSVQSAAETVERMFGKSPAPLYGLVNNAGIGSGAYSTVMATNFYGTVRMTNAFRPLLQNCGRIVNIASASGPNYVSRCSPEMQSFFTSRDVTWDELNDKAVAMGQLGSCDADAYGISKAFVNLFTMQTAKAHPDLIVNSCTPGFILTDMTAGKGATKSPEAGTVSPMHCLFGKTEDVGSGRYYGSDAVRSPLDRYRDPGDPPYIPTDD